MDLNSWQPSLTRQRRAQRRIVVDCGRTTLDNLPIAAAVYALGVRGGRSGTGRMAG